jgi:hypothetical protein
MTKRSGLGSKISTLLSETLTKKISFNPMTHQLLPKYPDHLRPCSSIQDAIDYLRGYDVKLRDRAVAYYPPVRQYETSALFSLNFFSDVGLNVGTYCLEMQSFQFQSGSTGLGRQWGACDLTDDDIEPYSWYPIHQFLK